MYVLYVYDRVVAQHLMLAVVQLGMSHRQIFLMKNIFRPSMSCYRDAKMFLTTSKL